VGAFDSYSAHARCPRCGDIHEVDGQTKFFVPDFFGLFSRWFSLWRPQTLDIDVAELQRARVWDDQWWRVREPGDPSRLDLLVDFDELFGCDCGLMFAVVLRFRVEAGLLPTATLTAIDLRDAASAAAVAVDFAEVEHMLWTGDRAAFAAELAALVGEPAHVRAERLQAALRQRFAAAPDEVAAGGTPWWVVHDDMRCEACGAVRRREEMMLLAHPDYRESFFGGPWPGGAVTRGTRFAGDFAWLADDRDRGYYVRLRHPVPEDRLVILGPQRRAGCGCGAGRGAVVLTFTREPGALVLADIAVRVVRTAEDLRDVDFAEAPRYTRDPPERAVAERESWSREAVLAAVLGAFTK